MSHPTRVRGLKRQFRHGLDTSVGSHPTRVRGLKQESRTGVVAEIRSHPTRVRGLKLLPCDPYACGLHVAPHAGAWIETRLNVTVQQVLTGRTPRGCVD